MKNGPSSKLATVLRKWRINSELSLRDVGQQIGIGAATLMRLEQGHEPDGPTLTKVLIWLLKPDTQNGKPKGAR